MSYPTALQSLIDAVKKLRDESNGDVVAESIIALAEEIIRLRIEIEDEFVKLREWVNARDGES